MSGEDFGVGEVYPGRRMMNRHLEDARRLLLESYHMKSEERLLTVLEASRIIGFVVREELKNGRV